jgi:hypothetical protein
LPVGSTLKKPHKFFVAALLFFIGRAVYADGALEGRVLFPGETPPPAMFTNHDDPKCPPGISQNHLRVRQESLGLQNAVVILESKEVRDPKAAPAQIAFDRCTLTPRVQWLPLGASLTILTKDGALHRIQVLNNGTLFINAELTPGRRPPNRPLMHVGFNEVRCGKHLWERAWIYVSPNPYAAVTADGGKFQIAHVPAGRYEIYAWHEGWKDLGMDEAGRPRLQPMEDHRTITIKDDKTTTVLFDQLQPTF